MMRTFLPAGAGPSKASVLASSSSAPSPISTACRREREEHFRCPAGRSARDALIAMRREHYSQSGPVMKVPAAPAETAAAGCRAAEGPGSGPSFWRFGDVHHGSRGDVLEETIRAPAFPSPAAPARWIAVALVLFPGLAWAALLARRWQLHCVFASSKYQFKKSIAPKVLQG